MTRGDRFRGVIVPGLVVAGTAGCAGGRPAPAPVARSAPPAIGVFTENLVVSATRVPDGGTGATR
jgi:hypothetical protein